MLIILSSLKKIMGERLIFIVDAAEDLSIDSYHLVHLMRCHGLQVRISFESEPNFDWKAEVSFMKKKLNFLGEILNKMKITGNLKNTLRNNLY